MGNDNITFAQSGTLPREIARVSNDEISQLGISVAPNGSLVVRYINGGGQRVTLDLTAIIEEKVDAGIKAHMEKYHGHQI